MAESRHVHRVIKLGNKGPDVKRLQQGINKTVDSWEFDWRRIEADGVAGHLTFKNAVLAGWLQGLSRAQLTKLKNGTATTHAQKVLRHDVALSDEMKRRQRRRRERAERMRHLHLHPPEDADGLATFDGKTVAAWFVGKSTGPDGKQVNWLQRIRDHGWTGTVVSGYRTPEYSEHLCYVICGAPTCPGRCAGRSTNHAQHGPPSWGAIDVSDYYTFARIAKEVGAPFHNGLPSTDPVHFSFPGN